jgi:hypothetical protein
MYVIGDMAYGATTSTDCVDMCSLEFVLTSVIILNGPCTLHSHTPFPLPPLTFILPVCIHKEWRVHEQF